MQKTLCQALVLKKVGDLSQKGQMLFVRLVLGHKKNNNHLDGPIQERNSKTLPVSTKTDNWFFNAWYPVVQQDNSWFNLYRLALNKLRKTRSIPVRQFSIKGKCRGHKLKNCVGDCAVPHVHSYRSIRNCPFEDLQSILRRGAWAQRVFLRYRPCLFSLPVILTARERRGACFLTRRGACFLT